MTGFGKFLVGTAGASLLAWGAHALTGADYIDGLEESGQTALSGSGIDGVTMSMARDPLARVAVLDGITDPEARAAAEAAVLATPGITAVRWANGSAVGDGEAGDGDGSADASDADATTGASAEAVVECQTDVDALLAGKVITFRTGSAYMPDSSLAIVDDVAELLGGCTGMSVAVGGHTDATGAAETNDLLSQARADAVATALAERGVGAARITATGYGSNQLAVPGDGANEANRRIDFTLSSGESDEGGE